MTNLVFSDLAPLLWRESGCPKSNIGKGICIHVPNISLPIHIVKEIEKVPYCPECGGEMRYDSSLKRYICKSCGLSVTYEELQDMRDRSKDRVESDEEKRKKRRKDYLDWWFSRKE